MKNKTYTIEWFKENRALEHKKVKNPRCGCENIIFDNRGHPMCSEHKIRIQTINFTSTEIKKCCNNKQLQLKEFIKNYERGE